MHYMLVFCGNIEFRRTFEDFLDFLEVLNGKRWTTDQKVVVWAFSVQSRRGFQAKFILLSEEFPNRILRIQWSRRTSQLGRRPQWYERQFFTQDWTDYGLRHSEWNNSCRQDACMIPQRLQSREALRPSSGDWRLRSVKSQKKNSGSRNRTQMCFSRRSESRDQAARLSARAAEIEDCDQ